jgi:hypothetical protein
VPLLRSAPIAAIGRPVYRAVARHRRRVLACGVGRPDAAPAVGPWYKAAVSLFIVLLVGAEVYAIAGPHEEWPFTSNTMFAYHRTADAPVYDLVLTVTDADGATRRLDPARDLGVANPEAFRRMFFAQWYGSTDPRFPQGHPPADGPEAFTARMGVFGARVVAVLRRRGDPPAAIGLSLVELTRTGDGAYTPQRHWPIGAYAVDTHAFTLAPRP